jgi:hypothetical protein
MESLFIQRTSKSPKQATMMLSPRDYHHVYSSRQTDVILFCVCAASRSSTVKCQVSFRMECRQNNGYTSIPRRDQNANVLMSCFRRNCLLRWLVAFPSDHDKQAIIKRVWRPQPTKQNRTSGIRHFDRLPSRYQVSYIYSKT